MHLPTLTHAADMTPLRLLHNNAQGTHTHMQLGLHVVHRDVQYAP